MRSDPKHEIGKRVVEFLLLWKHRSASATVDALDSLKQEIINFIVDIKGLILSTVLTKQLNTPENETLAFNVVTKYIFSKTYSNLWELYKQKVRLLHTCNLQYMEQDKLLSEKCITFKDVTPMHLGVEKKYWLGVRRILIQHLPCVA